MSRPGVAFSRSSALKRCFRHLDDDGSGYIEMHELKSIVGQVAPQVCAEALTHSVSSKIVSFARA